MSQDVGAKTKGWIKNNVTGKKKSFQFNPTEFQYSRGVTYTDISAPGMCYPDTQFVKGNARSFPIELFLYDKPCTGFIEEFMLFIGAFLTPEANVQNYSKPPSMTFCFGYFIRQCVLENLDIRVEEFDEDGEAVQARFTLQLRQVGV
jgi:hypothetical protein